LFVRGISYVIFWLENITMSDALEWEKVTKNKGESYFSIGCLLVIAILVIFIAILAVSVFNY